MYLGKLSEIGPVRDIHREPELRALGDGRQVACHFPLSGRAVAASREPGVADARPEPPGRQPRR